MMVALCVYISLPKGHGCHGVIPYSAGNRVGTANIPKISHEAMSASWKMAYFPMLA